MPPEITQPTKKDLSELELNNQKISIENLSKEAREIYDKLVNDKTKKATLVYKETVADLLARQEANVLTAALRQEGYNIIFNIINNPESSRLTIKIKETPNRKR